MGDPPAKSAVKCRMISPQFVLPDVVASAEYHRDVLGFRILGYFFNPPVHAIVARDSVETHFGKSRDCCAASPNTHHSDGSLDAYIWVTDLNPFHAELKERGAKIVEPPATRVYKCYEMVVEDNFGFRLAFAMDLSSSPAVPIQP